jgi:hypothetical protein
VPCLVEAIWKQEYVYIFFLGTFTLSVADGKLHLAAVAFRYKGYAVLQEISVPPNTSVV